MTMEKENLSSRFANSPSDGLTKKRGPALENTGFHANVAGDEAGSGFHKSERVDANIISVKDLIKECDRAVLILEKDGADWTDRVVALENLQKVATRGGAAHDEFLDYLVRLKDALCAQIKDLRSVIVKEACTTIGLISKAYQQHSSQTSNGKVPAAFAGLMMAVVETCLKQTCVTIKVISESADQCVRTVVESMAPHGVQKMLSLFCTGCSEKAGHIRFVCVEYIELALCHWYALRKSGGLQGRRVQEISKTLKSVLFDSDENVRRSARSCFWAFHSFSRDVAETLMNSLDDTTKRRVMDAKATAKTFQFAAPLSPMPGHATRETEKPKKKPTTPVPSTPGSFSSGSTGSSSANGKTKASGAKKPTPSPAQDAKQQQRRAMRVQRNDEYNASDYAEGSGVHATGGGARRVTGTVPNSSSTTTTGSSSGPARRMAGPQRVVKPPSTTQTSSGSKPTSALGGAVRVEPLKHMQHDDGGGQSSSTNGLMGGGSSVSSMMMSRESHGLGEDSHGSINLERCVKELNAATHWAARLEALSKIRHGYEEGSTHFPSSAIDKLVPILCERASDPHYKVAQEVLATINSFLKHFTKEFGENLKFLLPALLAGLSHSKASIRKLSDEALHQCLELYSPDTLSAVLSGLCRKKGDKLRLGCVEYLTQIVPKSKQYFANPLHVHQLVLRVEPILRSRKLELRKAATNLLVAVYRFDNQLFLSEMQSSELPNSIQSLLIKMMSPKIPGFQTAVANTPRHYSTSVSAPTSNVSAKSYNADDDTDNNTVGAETNTIGEEDDQSANNDDNEEDEHEHENETKMMAEVDEEEDEDDTNTEMGSMSVEEKSEETSSRATVEAVRETTQLPPSSPPREEQDHDVAPPVPPKPHVLIPQIHQDMDSQIMAIVNELARIDLPAAQARAALKKVNELVSKETSRQQVDWDKWFGQLKNLSVKHFDNEAMLVREEAINVLRSMIAHTDLLDDHFETVLMELLYCWHDPKSQVLSVAHTTLQELVKRTEATKAFDALYDAAYHSEDDMQLETLKQIRILLPRVNTPFLLEKLPGFMPILVLAFQSPMTSIRREVTNLYVDLHFILGESFAPYFNSLTLQQRKLVTKYIERESLK